MNGSGGGGGDGWTDFDDGFGGNAKNNNTVPNNNNIQAQQQQASQNDDLLFGGFTDGNQQNQGQGTNNGFGFGNDDFTNAMNEQAQLQPKPVDPKKLEQEKKSILAKFKQPQQNSQYMTQLPNGGSLVHFVLFVLFYVCFEIFLFCIL